MDKTSTAERRVFAIRELLKRKNLRQTQLAEKLDILPTNLSRCLTQNKVSDKMCRKIGELFPEFRLEWLFGNDDFPTEEEKRRATDSGIRHSAPITVLDTALLNVCNREGIDPPEISIPDFVLLESQLEDFAEMLITNYLHRENSHFWNSLDSALETIEEKLKK